MKLVIVMMRVASVPSVTSLTVSVPVWRVEEAGSAISASLYNTEIQQSSASVGVLLCQNMAQFSLNHTYVISQNLFKISHFGFSFIDIVIWPGSLSSQTP